jgi:hypothetical protein
VSFIGGAFIHSLADAVNPQILPDLTAAQTAQPAQVRQPNVILSSWRKFHADSKFRLVRRTQPIAEKKWA